MREGVEDTKTAFAEWQEYHAAEGNDVDEEAESYEGYEFTDGQWVHPTKRPYVEEYYDGYDEEEEDEDAKTSTATPNNLGLGPEHHRIYTPGRR